MHPEDHAEKEASGRIGAQPERAPPNAPHEEREKNRADGQSHRDQTEGMKRLESQPRGREGRAPYRDRHQGFRRPGAWIHLRGSFQIEGRRERIVT